MFTLANDVLCKAEAARRRVNADGDAIARISGSWACEDPHFHNASLTCTRQLEIATTRTATAARRLWHTELSFLLSQRVQIQTRNRRNSRGTTVPSLASRRRLVAVSQYFATPSLATQRQLMTVSQNRRRGRNRIFVRTRKHTAIHKNAFNPRLSSVH